MSHHHDTKLNVVAFGFAFGVTWAIGMLLLGWFSWWTGYGREMVAMISYVYIGYGATFWGAIIGMIWGFIDWFVGGIIIAAIYNACAGRKCTPAATETTTGAI